MKFSLATALLLGLFACSQTVTVGGGTAAMKEKDTANMAKQFAKNTPPAGATSMGMMTSPKVGSATVPITNVEVYVFTANIDDDAAGETLYWAIEGGVVYVWGTIDLVRCARR